MSDIAVARERDGYDDKGRFVKGHKLGGRPKGSIQQATLEIRAFCRAVVDSAEYRQRLMEDAQARRLSPAVELMLWDRAYGRVPTELRIDDASSMDTDSIVSRLRALALALPAVDDAESGDEAAPESNRAVDEDEPA